MDEVQSSIDVFVSSPSVYPDSDTKSIEVYLNNKTTYSSVDEARLEGYLNYSTSFYNTYDIASLDVYLTPPSASTYFSEKSIVVYPSTSAAISDFDTQSIIVGLNQTPASDDYDISKLTVFLNNNVDFVPEVKQSSVSINLSPKPVITDFDTKSLIVSLTGTASKATLFESSVTVGINRLISTNYIESDLTVYLTGDSPFQFVESSIIVIKYDTKYGDIRFTYPKTSNQPLGFEVVVYRALNGVYDPFNKASYLTPMKEVKQNTFIDENDSYYIYKSAWSPKAKDTEYPFKIAVRSVFFSGKSDWLVSVEHDI
jgi:hypothetical protein